MKLSNILIWKLYNTNHWTIYSWFDTWNFSSILWSRNKTLWLDVDLWTLNLVLAHAWFNTQQIQIKLMWFVIMSTGIIIKEFPYHWWIIVKLREFYDLAFSLNLTNSITIHSTNGCCEKAKVKMGPSTWQSRQ